MVSNFTVTSGNVQFKFIQYNESVVVTDRSCDEVMYSLIGKARASRLTTSIFVTYFQMTLVRPLHVLNNGSCVVHGSTGYRCTCPLGYSGIHCESKT